MSETYMGLEIERQRVQESGQPIPDPMPRILMLIGAGLLAGCASMWNTPAQDAT
jgi:hypothetical protein